MSITSKSKKSRADRALVFAENQNDGDALEHLAAAIWEQAPPIHYRRKPLVLIKGRNKAEARKNAEMIAQVVRAESVLYNVTFVIAHQDCDSVEPHEPVAAQIKAEITEAGVQNVIAVAPAWELEAWWYLWPTAVASVNSKWKRLSRKGNHGMLSNAKETLTRDLRAPGTSDYRESDSIKIAKYVREKKLVAQRTGIAPSFDSFETAVLEVSRTPRAL